MDWFNNQNNAKIFKIQHASFSRNFTFNALKGMDRFKIVANNN
jgi:hypothetical protein